MLQKKMTVIAVLQRNGRIALEYVNKKNNIANIKPVLAKYIDLENAILNTDASPLYKGYTRNVVNYSKGEYVKGNATTNGIESTFSHFKRMLNSTYIHISKHHITKYITTFCFRRNNNKLTNCIRFNAAMMLIFDKKVNYANIIA